MKNKRIKIGSQVFFSKYPDYTSHDKDFVEFQEKPELYRTFMNVKGKGNDIFYYKTMTKQEFIEYLFMVHFLGLIFMILFGLFGIIKYGGALIL